MANKNYAGTQFERAKREENRLISKIDKHEGNGKNRKNVDNTFANHTHSADGERVWSY